MNMASLQHLNWFDSVIIGIFVFSILVSFFRGFVKEAISLVVWVLAVVLGLKFTPSFGVFFNGFVQPQTLAYVIAFIIIFVLVLLVGIVLNASLKMLLEKIGLGPIDRRLGILFGAARAFLAATIIILFVQASPMHRNVWYRDAQLPPIFVPTVNWIDNYLPKKMQHLSHWISGVPEERVQQASHNRYWADANGTVGAVK